jgi:hypothetical protein
MLYILGGASRSGKSIIGRRFVSELNIPFFCLDFLITSLHSVPSLGITHGQPSIEKAEKLWPLSKSMFGHLISEEPNYLIEGDAILPKQVNELSDTYGSQIKCCFVGYSEISVEQKLQEIRKFGGSKDDWTQKYNDEQMKKYIFDMIDYSRYLKAECRAYNLKYIDLSNNFESELENIFNFLSNNKSS